MPTDHRAEATVRVRKEFLIRGLKKVDLFCSNHAAISKVIKVLLRKCPGLETGAP